jgi:thermitase
MKSKIIVNLKKGISPQDVLPATIMADGNTDSIIIKPLYSVLDKPENLKYKKQEGMKSIEEVNDIENSLLNDLGEEEKRIYRTYVIELPDNVRPEDMAELLNKNEGVNYAQVNEMNQLLLTPNDPLYPELYGHRLIECEKAWNINQGQNIVVAVVDTGVDYNHPDISMNIWKDANGNIGYNFSEDTNDPMDYHSHGTHVSGTIASTGNNSKGIIGVSFQAKIMPLKVFPNADDQTCARAIKYAADNGARIINNSWGPTRRRISNHTVEDAIDYAVSKGSIVIFAAGNNSDDVQYYSPANYHKVICVAATDNQDKLADFSNFGTNVTISAPGKDICSLKYRSNEYIFMSGTSMAAPHVSAVAALICSKYPGITESQVRDRLKTYADSLSSNRPAGSGRVNAYKVL